MRLWLAAPLRAALEAEAARAFPLETGGALMGYWSGDDAVVTDVIGPGPRAVHRADSFDPDDAFHAAEIARIYAGSGRLHTYLGDWHTHPHGPLALSGLDRATVAAIARAVAGYVPRAVMALAAGAPGAWQLGAWCGARALVAMDLR